MSDPTVGNRLPDVIPSGLGELISEITAADQHEGVALGTAQFMGLLEAINKYGIPSGKLSERLWIGEAFNDDRTSLGYSDDRHVTLVANTRAGKSGIIVPNLCLWLGSLICIDPKGIDAALTARRRGGGSDYAVGLGQEVWVLDPCDEAAEVPRELKGRYNPMDTVDVTSDMAVDDAKRIATAIIVRENKNDPFWEDTAQILLTALILHVLTFRSFKNIRNLVTVRRLLMEGDWLTIEAGKALGLEALGLEKMPGPFEALWDAMTSNKAFDGVIAGVGTRMAVMADKTRDSVMSTASTATAFLDGAPMRRQVETSDFDLASIKNSARGLTLYLVPPTRYEDYFRWLRLMVVLTIGEMERIKGRPQTGHPTLFLLDEFAGLKKMPVIEKAIAQSAEFGVKFFFVVQNLVQLKIEYGDGWETFISNSGLKIFFGIDEQFTREYLSKLLGEREVRRKALSGSGSRAAATAVGGSVTDTSGRAPSVSFGGAKESFTMGAPGSKARGESHTQTQTNTIGEGWADGVHKRPLLSPDEIGRFFSRIDEKDNPAYPGLMVALIPGQHPLVARRINYFQSPKFAGCFDPHPDHPPPPTLAELAAREASRKAMPHPQPEIARQPTRAKPDAGSGGAESRWLRLPKKIIIAAACLGLVLFAGVAASTIWKPKPPIISGPAVVDAPQLNLRSCAAATCRSIATLNRGDGVTVTQSLNNGWKGITVRDAGGKVIKGFVNGEFLSQA